MTYDLFSFISCLSSLMTGEETNGNGLTSVPLLHFIKLSMRLSISLARPETRPISSPLREDRGSKVADTKHDQGPLHGYPSRLQVGRGSGNKSPKSNMCSAIPVALLCMMVNWSERRQGSGSKGDEVL